MVEEHRTFSWRHFQGRYDFWKVLNEVLKEVGMPIVRRCAWTVSVFDPESRYDTRINDMLLALVPFSALGLHVVTVLDFPDPIPQVDKNYILQLLLLLLQFNLFNQTNQSNSWFEEDFGLCLSVNAHPERLRRACSR